MMDLPIKAGKLYIKRIEEDLLEIKSVRHYELLRLSTGKLLLDVKEGFLGFDIPFILPPGGKVIAVAENEGLQVHDGGSGKLIHYIRYPKGKEGLKTARQIKWLGEDVIATIFPDKKGNPRRMSAFSSSTGKLLWSVGLPESADYELTSKQRAQLIQRITMSLFATAASVGHPMSVGGSEYTVVMFPDLDVSMNLDAGRALDHVASLSVIGENAPYALALRRSEECRILMAPASTGHSYFAKGPEGNYEILRIRFDNGNVTPVFTYNMKRVHSIAFFPGFERALSVESNNRRVRLLSLH
jgi:hypothetical protein